MRIENTQIRTKSLYAAAFLMTKGARYIGIEWLDDENAEFTFGTPEGIDSEELIKSFYTDGLIPGKTYGGNHSYLRSLLFQSKQERIKQEA